MEIEMLDAPEVHDDPANAIGQTSIALVQGTLAEFDKVAAGLADLNAKYRNVVYDVTTTKGMLEAKAARVAVREPRYAVARAATAAKQPLNALKKDIDARAAQITAALITLEEPIDAQIDAEETRKAKEKAAREASERARVLAITQRIAEIKEYANLALDCRTSERIHGLLEKITAKWLACNFEDDFEEFGEEAQQAFNNTRARLQELIEAKKADEAERARVKAEQEAAAAKLAADRAELERQQAEAAAAQAKAAAEDKTKRDAEAAELQRQREAFATEQATARAAQQAEADRLQAQADELARQRAELAPKPDPASMDRSSSAMENVVAMVQDGSVTIIPAAPFVGAAAELDALAVPDAEEPADPTTFIHAPEVPDPTDSEVIWTAATALTHAYGWSTAESIRRLSEMDWTPA